MDLALTPDNLVDDGSIAINYMTSCFRSPNLILTNLFRLVICHVHIIVEHQGSYTVYSNSTTGLLHQLIRCSIIAGDL